MNQEKTTNQPLHIRPPIVVIMGHIDHGKTTILDWYRKTKVVESESGGITQHIGAYVVRHHDRTITFIDTPGHEAFSKMRSRSTRVADIAVIVIAADEGVRPQTKEVLSIAQNNNLPFIIALNKIDKPEANTERVKQELAQENILVESYGGKIPCVEISAKSGKNMDDLLEMILLMAELEHLTTDSEAHGTGVVIEARQDPRRGITATLLVRDGTLYKKDILTIERSIETIKIFEDFLGYAIDSASASSPVYIVGLSVIPAVGDTFHAWRTRYDAEEYIASFPPSAPQEKISLITPADNSGKPIFNIILKADVAGSLEVLEESFRKITSAIISINILRAAVGDINETDIKLALATKLVTVVGFKVTVDHAVRELARASNIHVITGDIIYELLERVKKEMNEMLPPEIKRIDVGRAKILKLFKKEGMRQVVGGRVEEGTIKKGARADITRFKEVVGQGTILELQHNKQKEDHVEKGAEFGILIESKTMVEVGDVVHIYEEELIRRTV